MNAVADHCSQSYAEARAKHTDNDAWKKRIVEQAFDAAQSGRHGLATS